MFKASRIVWQRRDKLNNVQSEEPHIVSAHVLHVPAPVFVLDALAPAQVEVLDR